MLNRIVLLYLTGTLPSMRGNISPVCRWDSPPQGCSGPESDGTPSDLPNGFFSICKTRISAWRSFFEDYFFPWKIKKLEGNTLKFIRLDNSKKNVSFVVKGRSLTFWYLESPKRVVWQPFLKDTGGWKSLAGEENNNLLKINGIILKC